MADKLQSWDDFGCMYQDTVFVPLSASPHLDFLHDTLICSNQNFVIAFPVDGNTYYWNTYGNQTDFYITGDLQLILNIQNQDGCISTDTLNIHTVNCDDALPNIITPNGDGVNDFFIIDESVIQPNNRLIIFNRWGNTIFEAAPYKNDFNGFDCVEGVYFYRYFPDRDKNESESGFLTIIR